MRIYFSGAYAKSDAELLLKGGAKNCMYSYLDLKGINNLVLPPFDSIMLDSGAYTAFTQNEYISIKAYSLWLQLNLSNYPQITCYVNLDAIGDAEETLKNQQFLESEGLSPLPVYHYREPTDILDNYCSKYEYVGLGGLAGKNTTTSNITKLWESRFNRYKDNKFHLFGVGGMKPFYRYQPFSIDSTAWIWNRGQCHIAGYHNGVPDTLDLSENNSGWKLFIPYQDITVWNIMAMVDWEKLEWLKNVKEGDYYEKPMLF